MSFWVPMPFETCYQQWRRQLTQVFESPWLALLQSKSWLFRQPLFVQRFAQV